MVIKLSSALSSDKNSATNLSQTKSESMFNKIKLFALMVITTMTFISSGNAYALSSVNATIDKNPAMMNESILLTVTADDDVDRDALDTSPLAKDFIVGQSRVSSQTSIVNFSATRLTTWKIILIARKVGQYEIPALSIDNLKTQPIQLNVIAASKNASQRQTDIFITSELSSNEVYVQQSLTLSIKLHFATELHSASMDQPSFTGALIEKIGEDQQSDSIINGKRYRIIEQKYSITPEQSGRFTINGPVFSGEVSDGTSRRSTFRSFTQTKPVSIIGDSLEITVLPIPDQYPSNDQWLPTEILTLHQEWQGSNGQYFVGEPITRTIRLTASGLSKAQLPKLEMDSIRGLKVYPDQAELHSSLRDNRLISQKVQNFALMPSTPGKFTLPEVSVTWFNTVTNRVEKATLPAQTITVLPSQDTLNATTTSNNNYNTPVLTPNHNQTELLIAEAEKGQQAPVVVEKTSNLQWLFLALWLITLLAWYIHVHYITRRGSLPNTSKLNVITKTGNHYAALLTACKKNQADEAQELILPWLQQLLTNKATNVAVINVSQAQQMLNDENFNHAVNALQAQLYGKASLAEESTWQGNDLYNAVKAINDNHRKKTSDAPTISLNP